MNSIRKNMNKYENYALREIDGKMKIIFFNHNVICIFFEIRKGKK